MSSEIPKSDVWPNPSLNLEINNKIDQIYHLQKYKLNVCVNSFKQISIIICAK